MKVLTLKQPWATLVAEGIKKYEFRTWKTKFRGKILIHAGIGVDKEAMNMVKDLGFDFPSGKIIALVNLEDCLELDDKLNNIIINENNIAYGTKYRTGYAWKISNVVKIDCLESIKGQLGLWNYEINEDELLKKCNNF